MRISDWSSDVCSSDLRSNDYRGLGWTTTIATRGTRMVPAHRHRLAASSGARAHRPKPLRVAGPWGLATNRLSRRHPAHTTDHVSLTARNFTECHRQLAVDIGTGKEYASRCHGIGNAGLREREC